MGELSTTCTIWRVKTKQWLLLIICGVVFLHTYVELTIKRLGYQGLKIGAKTMFDTHNYVDFKQAKACCDGDLNLVTNTFKMFT